MIVPTFNRLQLFFVFRVNSIRFFFVLSQRERKQKKLYSDEWTLGDEDEIDGRRTFNLQEKLEDPVFESHGMVKEMRGEELNVAYFQKYGFNTPLLFKDKTGLGKCWKIDLFLITKMLHNCLLIRIEDFNVIHNIIWYNTMMS